MISTHMAFKTPIALGKARIFLKFGKIICEVENNAPDFISVDKDKPSLKVIFPEGSRLNENVKDLDLEFLEISDERIVLHNIDEGLWFDIDVEEVKDIWLADMEFIIHSKNPRYLAYFIQSLEYQFEWLQQDVNEGDIKLMSVSKKKYNTPKFTGKEKFTSKEVIICADMLSRAIAKIDLRTGGANVKFNTEKGRLEPLIVGIADKLGYVIEPLSSKEMVLLEVNGQSPSHSIRLKK